MAKAVSRRGRGRGVLSDWGRRGVFAVPSEDAEGLPAYEPAAVFAHGVSVAVDDRIAVEDGSAALVAYQVRVDYTVV